MSSSSGRMTLGLSKGGSLQVLARACSFLDSPRSPLKRVLRYSLLLIVPALMVVATLWLGAARGPYWVGMNHDPGLQYLLNSLNLATLRPVGHTVHPGTPSQVAGAAVMRVVHFVAAPEGQDLRFHALANPGLYLKSIRLTYLFLNAFALLALGVVVLKLLNLISLALVAQLAPFYPHVNSTFVFGSTQARPDSFLLLGALLMAVGVVFYTQRAAELQHDDGPATARQREQLQDRTAMVFGLICGFAMAAKVNFLPLLVLPLVLLQGLKPRLSYVGVTIASFVFFTLPILAEYPRMAAWLAGLAVNSGIHGQGTATFIDTDLFLANLRGLLSIEVVFARALLISLGVVTISYVVPRFRRIAVDNIYFRSLLGVTATQLAGLAVVAKHFSGWETYYLISTSCLTGLALLLTVVCVAQLVADRRTVLGNRFVTPGSTNHDLLLPILATLGLVGAVVMTYGLRRDELYAVHDSYSRARDQRIDVYETVDREYGNFVRIHYLGSSAPAYAWFLSNSEARHYYSVALEKRFPNTYFYDTTTGQFSDWYEQSTSLEEIRALHGERILFQGPTFAELRADMSSGSTEPSGFREPLVALAEVIPPGDDDVPEKRRETIYLVQPENSRSN